MNKDATLKIAGRTFPLAFTMDAMCELQKTIPDFNLADLAEYVKNPEGMLALITALAREGAYLEGHELDVDRRWFGAHLKPSPAQITKMQVAVFNALTEGMSMETEDESAEEVDVVLEEIKKKDGTDA